MTDSRTDDYMAQLAEYIDWVLEHDARAWAETGGEAADHIVNVLGWRPPATQFKG